VRRAACRRRVTATLWEAAARRRDARASRGSLGKAGRYRTLGGWRIFTIDTGPVASVEEPVLVLHGFPTSSYDFHFVIDSLAAKRRVLALDMLGYGLSDKPDVAYTMALQADIVAAFVADAGVERLALLTHDMGDTVGGELPGAPAGGHLAGRGHPPGADQRSIYIELAQLSAGQLLLLSMPDRQIAIEAFDEASLAEALRATFSPAAQFEQAELDAMADFVLVNEGRPCCPPDPLHRGAASQPGALHRPDRAPPVAAYHHLGRGRPHRSAGHGPTTRRSPPRRDARAAERRRPLSDGRGARALHRLPRPGLRPGG